MHMYVCEFLCVSVGYVCTGIAMRRVKNIFYLDLRIEYYCQDVLVHRRRLLRNRRPL